MLSRSALAARNAALLRAQARRNALAVTKRLNSTQSSSTTQQQAGGLGSHFVSGLIGGGVVLGGVYAYYHYSGAAKVVNTAKQLRDNALQAKDKALEKVPNTSEALTYLRQTAKAYAIFIPGGASYVDSTFDNLEEARQTHGQEVDEIVRKAYDEIKRIVDAGGADFETAAKVASVLRERGKQLAEVARKAGGDLLDKYPEAKEQLGGAYQQLEKFANSRGEEGKKIMKDVQKQLGDMFAKGGANKDEVVKKAQEFLQSKQKDLSGLGEDAWKKGLEQAKPYLDKVPDLRKTLEQNKEALAGIVAGGGSELWERVKKAAEGGKKDQQKAVEELKSWIKEKSEQAQQGGEETWDKLEDLIKQLPGGQSVLAASPDLKQATEAFKKKAPEAQEIAQAALRDIVNVLKEKGKQMEELGKETKDEATKK